MSHLTVFKNYYIDRILYFVIYSFYRETEKEVERMTDLNRAIIPHTNVFGPMLERFAAFQYPIAVRYHNYQVYFLHESHLHDYPQMWYCLKGTYTHTVDDVEFACSPGSVVIVPPGVFHKFEISADKPTEIICMEGTFFFFDKMQEPARTNMVTNLFCPQFGDELGFTPTRFVMLPDSERACAEGLLLSLCKIDYRRGVTNISNVCQKIGDFFSLPSFALSDTQRKSAEAFIRNKLSPMMDAISYMNKNYAKKIHREELIGISTLCQTDFFRLIKKIVGTTYARYLQMIRLRRAQTMISFSTFSFSYIADNCGFGSWRYLSRLFKQHFGITMQEERKKRNALVKRYPNMIMTREYWEKLNIE